MRSAGLAQLSLPGAHGLVSVQELLDCGVCAEVERVRLSARYRSMKVRAGQGGRRSSA